MEDTSNITETELQQPVVLRSVLAELRKRLFESQQLTQSFDYGEARWRDGMESGLETAIEVIKEISSEFYTNIINEIESDH